MDISTTSARYPNGVGEPSARALFRAEATAKSNAPKTPAGELVDDQKRKEAKLIRARFDVTLGGYTRFI